MLRAESSSPATPGTRTRRRRASPVVRYLSTGTLDTTFNATGKGDDGVGAGIDAATALAIDSNNNIVVVGFTTNTTLDFAIARYTSAGASRHDVQHDRQGDARVRAER